MELPTVLLTVEIQVGFSSVPMGLPEKNVLSPVFGLGDIEIDLCL